MTPADLINVLDQATPQQCNQIAHILGYPSVCAPEMLDQLWLTYEAQVGNPIGQPMTVMVNRNELRTQTVLDKTKPHTELDWKVVAEGIILLTLLLGGDIVPSCECTTYTLRIPGCDPNVEPTDLIVPTLVEVVDGFPRYSAEGIQQLINMASKLLQCCNPCVETEFSPGESFTDEFIFNSIETLSAVEISIQQNTNPARIAWNPPETTELGGVQRFGKFIFTFEDGTSSGVYFLNYQDQIFNPSRPGCKGFRCFLNPGVRAQFFYKTQPDWPGQTSPP